MSTSNLPEPGLPEPGLPEPWLRGPIEGVDPLLAPALCSFQQVREDLALHTEGLTTEQVWARPHGLAPLGFQLRHIAGSVDRLTTCLEGEQLSQAQLETKDREMEPGATVEELLAGVDRALRRTEHVIRSLDAEALREPRRVGRLRLPATVQGLVMHIAEHTQRHLGQAISAAKLARVA
ncbi:MAG: DinB family protein [Bryobacteraceae bacterium]